MNQSNIPLGRRRVSDVHFVASSAVVIGATYRDKYGMRLGNSFVINVPGIGGAPVKPEAVQSVPADAVTVTVNVPSGVTLYYDYFDSANNADLQANATRYPFVIGGQSYAFGDTEGM